jgi:biotin transport system substrate-specific component
LPVFAAGGGLAYLVGPTGGYLLAFPLAAGVAGWASWRSERLVVLAAGSVAAVALIHTAGAAWLSVATGGAMTFRAVVLPFLPGDVLKIALAILIGSRLRTPVRRAIG